MNIMNNYNTKQQEKVIKSQDWEDILKLLTDNICQNIHCATLAFYEGEHEKWSEKGYGIAKFKPFPLTNSQNEYTIYAYYFNQETEEDFAINKIYCILFMDNNFRANLETNYPIKTSDPTIHSLSFGVVLKTC